MTMQIIELEFKGVQISCHLGNSGLSLSIDSFPVCKGREKRSWFTVFAYAHFPQQFGYYAIKSFQPLSYYQSLY